MDLGNYTGGGAGRGFSTADQSMAASGTTGSISGGYSGPSGGNGGGGGDDPYARFVKASQPRGGLNAIKNYFTSDGYDYGYQRSFGKDLRGIGGFLLSLINPRLGLALRGYQTIKPEEKTIKDYIDITKSISDSDIGTLEERIARTTGYDKDNIKTVSDLALISKGPFYFGAQTDPELMVTGGANIGPFSYMAETNLNDLGKINQSAGIGLAPGISYFTDFDGINSIIGSRTFDTPFGNVNVGGQYNLNTDDYGLGLNLSRKF